LTSGVTRFDPLSLNPIIAYEMHESMMAPLASESLDLDPANPSSLDIITATRAGTATYTDASGNIQTASPNTVRVDHVQGEELTPTKFQRVGYTDFSSGWVNNGSSDVAGSGYSGQPSVVITGTNNTASLYFNCPAVVGQEYIISMYIRRVSGTGTIRMRHVGAVEGTETDVTITNDWSRVEVPFTANSTSIPIGPLIQVSGESVEISQPQVEEGTTVSDFVANTTGSPKYFAAATYGPRVPMILVEPAATNLVENTDFSDWIAATYTTLTDGSGYAGQPSKIFEAGGTHRIFQTRTFTSVSGATYTGSIWIRRVSGTGAIYINHQDSAQGNLTAITNDISEDWTRVEVNFTGHASSGNMWFAIWVSVQGDSVEIAMPQVERGTVATSFIPTSGSAVTRAADDLVIDGSDFTDFYNQSEGTVYVEYNPRTSDTYYPFAMSDGSSGNYTRLNGGGNYRIKVGGVEQTSTLLGASNLGQINRVAASWAANNFDGSVNGGAVVSDSTGTVPTVDQLQIGGLYYTGYEINGHIKRLIYWPHHSDNL